MSSSDPSFTAGMLAEKLASGMETSVSLVKQALDRTEAHGDEAIFIALTAEKALQEARASDERRKEGRPLSAWDGIPMVWKDLFDIEGLTTTAGSRVYADAPPAEKDAPVVARCKGAGLVSIGKTNLSEFAYSGLGLNPHYGTPVNPHSGSDPKVPGGSSSGSAAAVAAGLVPIATGTDTAGSVRVPASFCGLYGFKASQHHYDRSGVFPLSRSLDSVGIFANDVDDLIVLDHILRGREADRPASDPGVSPNLIVPENIVFDGIADDVAAAFETSVEALVSAGISVSRRSVPIFDDVVDLAAKHGTLTVAEAATFHKYLLDSPDADRMDQLVRQRMLGAHELSAQDYITLQWARERLQRQMREYLSGGFLYFPTVAIPAPSIAALQASDEVFVQTNLLALRNTIVGSYLGMPGMNIPIGKTGEGLPVGGLISAANGQDEAVLAAGRAIWGLLRTGEN